MWSVTIMPFNQLRANIRNAMVPMNVAEAWDYAASFDHAETKGYAEEFARELAAEVDDFDDPEYCHGSIDHKHHYDPDSISVCSDGDETAYIDVNCKYCGRSGCVGRIENVDW
jgi:hypothetical protein